MNRFYLLIGSNHEPVNQVLTVMEQLSHFLGSDVRFSDVLETKAVDKLGAELPEGKTYLNVVAEGNTPYSLEELSKYLKRLEDQSGRQHGAQAEGRVTLDLDLVEWNDKVLRPADAAQSYYLECRKNLE